MITPRRLPPQHFGCDAFVDLVDFPHREMTQQELEITADLQVKIEDYYAAQEDTQTPRLLAARKALEEAKIEAYASPSWQEAHRIQSQLDAAPTEERGAILKTLGLTTESWCSLNTERYRMEDQVRAAEQALGEVEGSGVMYQVECERPAALIELGFLAGQLDGFRIGVKLITNMVAKRLDNIPGIDPDTLAVDLAGAMVDDDLATRLLARMLEVEVPDAEAPEEESDQETEE